MQVPAAVRGRARVRVVVLLAVLTALVVAGAAAYPHRSEHPAVAVVAVAPATAQPATGLPTGTDAAVPVPGSVPSTAQRSTSTSRAQSRGRHLQLACPTRKKPGCKLWFITHDTGWRIHPVYGYHSCHTGIDLRGNYGAKIRAAAAGRVIRVIHGDPAYGNVTLIQDNSVVRTMYAHQSRIGVHVGQQVRQGQVIGRIGATGFATGPHLHFEVHLNRRPYDPAGWFGGKMHPIKCYPGLKY